MAQKQTETFGYSPSEYKKFRNYAVRYLLLFSLLYCFLYCTRLNLSGAGAVMMSELGWSSSQFGILTGTMLWTYGIGQLINGRLSEVFGPARFVFWSALLSAGVNILFGFQSSIVVMAVLWGLNGYFQSMAWTPGLAALTNWWPGNTRGFATGFAHAFSGFGQAAATLAVALSFQAFPKLGWRAAFFFPAAFPLMLVILYKLFCRTSPKDIGLAEYKEEDPEREANEAQMRALVTEHGKLYPYKYLLRNGKFWIWIIIAWITGLGRYGLSTWIPMYFVNKFQMDISAGLLQSLTLPVGMGIGTLIVPMLTDKFCPTNRMPAVNISAIVGAVAVGGIVALDPRQPGQLVLLEVLLFIAGFCIYAISGISWAVATDIGGRVFSGTASGILNFFASVGGAMQSMLYGFLLEHMGWNTVFFSIAGLCAFIVVLGFAGSYQKKTV